jgi:hypothetical protein
MVKSYRKRPVVIKAVQFTGDNIGQVLDFTENKIKYDPKSNEYCCETLEGFLHISKNDFIIKGVNGEFYPCKPDIFEKSYEEI